MKCCQSYDDRKHDAKAQRLTDAAALIQTIHADQAGTVTANKFGDAPTVMLCPFGLGRANYCMLFKAYCPAGWQRGSSFSTCQWNHLPQWNCATQWRGLLTLQRSLCFVPFTVWPSLHTASSV